MFTNLENLYVNTPGEVTLYFLQVLMLCILNRNTCRQHLYFLANSLHPLPTIVFANSLDPDQAQQNVGPDLDPKLFEKSTDNKKA